MIGIMCSRVGAGMMCGHAGAGIMCGYDDAGMMCGRMRSHMQCSLTYCLLFYRVPALQHGSNVSWFCNASHGQLRTLCWPMMKVLLVNRRRHRRAILVIDKHVRQS